MTQVTHWKRSHFSANFCLPSNLVCLCAIGAKSLARRLAWRLLMEPRNVRLLWSSKFARLSEQLESIIRDSADRIAVGLCSFESSRVESRVLTRRPSCVSCRKANRAEKINLRANETANWLLGAAQTEVARLICHSAPFERAIGSRELGLPLSLLLPTLLGLIDRGALIDRRELGPRARHWAQARSGLT